MTPLRELRGMTSAGSLLQSNRFGSRDAVPLTVSDLDDALVRAAGDDERQDPRYNPPD
jgi:hypothetical protein